MRDWPSLVVRFPANAAAELRDLVSACLYVDQVAGVEERSETEWLVSFRTPDARHASLDTIAAAFGDAGVGVAALDVSDEDWAQRSQAELGAVTVGRLLIVPPWHAPSPADGGNVQRLVIEPSMGFGSGHHATTRLCLTALQSRPVTGLRVLDIGTGSGILAIAAALLGASNVLGVDNDPDALESARADAALNGLTTRVEFAEGDFRLGTLAASDLVLANLTGSMLAANITTLAHCVKPGGRLIMSGITTAEAPMVLDACSGVFNVLWRGDEDGWVGFLLEPSSRLE